VPANIAEAAVAHHRAREQTRFEKNLEPVANAKDHAAAVCKFLDRLHYRRKARDGAGPQIIAMRESTRQNDSVAIHEILRLVPDEFDRFVQHTADGVKRVVITIGSGKDYDSEFHCVLAP
jgi:hypothetical protein